MTSKLKTLIAAAAVLYGAEALADNTSPSMLSSDERVTLETLMPEDFDKFVLHAEPRPFRDKTFLNADGDEIDLHSFDGGLTLVNLLGDLVSALPAPNCQEWKQRRKNWPTRALRLSRFRSIAGD